MKVGHLMQITISTLWLGFTLCTITEAQTPNIPDLKWTPRVGWYNVKTQGKAAGNGIANDAGAIQAALNRLTVGSQPSSAVLYFPPGTYRIDSTLVLKDALAKMIVGCGRNTVIKWNGPAGGTMFQSAGTTRSMFNGITWDGNGKAGTGILHRSSTVNGNLTRFECQIRHENEAFVNFPNGYGITTNDRAGWANPAIGIGYATSETEVRNCLFDNCKTGVAVLFFNYYNWVIEGCEFNKCTYGIRTENMGQVYVRFCHFEKSKEWDVYTWWSSGNSVRWCTSKGSKHFVYGEDICIQDCIVDSWTGTDCAIQLCFARAPFLISDILFLNPPAKKVPPVLTDTVFNHDTSWVAAYVTPDPAGQKIVVSNIQCPGTTFSDSTAINNRTDAQIVSVPQGDRSIICPSLNALSRFLKSSVKNGIGTKGKLFTVSDSLKIQSAINGAKLAGSIDDPSVVYIPEGRYDISKTIEVDGSNYIFCGSGSHTVFNWIGDSSSPVFAVSNTKNVRMENFEIQHSRKNAASIIQTGGSASGSTIAYDRIWMPSQNVDAQNINSPKLRGLNIENCGPKDTVDVVRIIGQFRVSNSSEAIVLARFIDGAPIWIEGDGKSARKGIVGMLTCNGANIHVNNSQNLFAGDQYMEQVRANVAIFTGNPGDLPGRVTIGGARLHSFDQDTLFRVRNYCGRIAYVCGDIDKTDDQPMLNVWSHSGTNDVDLMLSAVYFPDDFKNNGNLKMGVLGGSAHLSRLACKYVDDISGTTGIMSQTLDDLRKLYESAYSMIYKKHNP